MWQAKFSNGDIIREINSKGQEILFGKVLARDDLESLSILLGNKMFTVRMEDGRFSSNNSGLNGDENHFFASDIDTAALKNIRPIYFVRETVLLSINARALSSDGPPAVNFTALGFQANLNGHNIKRYLAIFPNGLFVIRDK